MNCVYNKKYYTARMKKVDKMCFDAPKGMREAIKEAASGLSMKQGEFITWCIGLGIMEHFYAQQETAAELQDKGEASGICSTPVKDNRRYELAVEEAGKRTKC